MAFKAKSTHNHTEYTIQNILWKYYRDHSGVTVVPNVKVFRWESDVVVMTPSGFTVEIYYEFS